MVQTGPLRTHFRRDFFQIITPLLMIRGGQLIMPPPGRTRRHCRPLLTRRLLIGKELTARYTTSRGGEEQGQQCQKVSCI